MFSERRSYSPRTASFVNPPRQPLIPPGNIAGLAITKDHSIVFLKWSVREEFIHTVETPSTPYYEGVLSQHTN